MIAPRGRVVELIDARNGVPVDLTEACPLGGPSRDMQTTVGPTP